MTGRTLFHSISWKLSSEPICEGCGSTGFADQRQYLKNGGTNNAQPETARELGQTVAFRLAMELNGQYHELEKTRDPIQ